MITLAIILKKSNSKGTKKSPSDREELVKRVDEKNVDGYMGQVLAMGEVLMFVRENIAQLVGQALGVAILASMLVCECPYIQ